MSDTITGPRRAPSTCGRSTAKAMPRGGAGRHDGRVRSGPVLRDHGRVGLGEVDAAALSGRSRHADERPRVHRRRRHHDPVGEAAHPAAARQVGFVFQAFNLIPTLTAKENITLPLDIAGRDVDQGWFDSVVDTVRFRDRLSHRPAELSGGQQQRVAAARALVCSRRSCSRTSRRATSTRSRRRAAGVPARRGRRPRAVDRDGHARCERGELRGPDRVPADGRVVDEMLDPNTEKILDRLKSLEACRRCSAPPSRACSHGSSAWC